jgi:hypothetical protein
VLLSGSLGLTTAKAQNRENFKGYSRETQSIVTYDANTLQPLDSIPVKEILEINSNTPVEYQNTSNVEVFMLMEEEELMRENRTANNPE